MQPDYQRDERRDQIWTSHRAAQAEHEDRADSFADTHNTSMTDRPSRTLFAGGGISQIDHVGSVAFSAHFGIRGLIALETFWRRSRRSAKIVENVKNFRDLVAGAGFEPFRVN
jgi:hypothetical protein